MSAADDMDREDDAAGAGAERPPAAEESAGKEAAEKQASADEPAQAPASEPQARKRLPRRKRAARKAAGAEEAQAGEDLASADEQAAAAEAAAAAEPPAAEPTAGARPEAAEVQKAELAQEADEAQDVDEARDVDEAQDVDEARETEDAQEARASKRGKSDEPAAKQPDPAARVSASATKRGLAGRGKRGKQAPRRRVVRAHARYVRTSARKARMVCGHLRGKSVQEARAILAFTPREVASDWSKLLESAVANAESNHELLEDDLIIREAYANEGPTIKRFRPRAMGRATSINKRTSHLTIALTTSPEPAQTTKKRS